MLTPTQLADYLNTMTKERLKVALMLWGPPGVGKSSVVAQVAAGGGLEVIDLRLSQLAPTDLRGLPVPEALEGGGGVSRWYPPEFLPRGGEGILFLDELNMAPPAMQGVAQQLILDRRVGSYALPDGWLVWAAGNRKEDRASVFDMPAPLANRFLHLEIVADFPAWRDYALTRGLAEQILAFLTFRPELLHRLDTVSPAWPSPRSWEMASRLHALGLDIAPAVGEAAAAEFAAFVRLYAELPDLGAVLRGQGAGLGLPSEASVRYAAVVGLAARAEDPQQAGHAMRWIGEHGGAEWLQLYFVNLLPRLRLRGGLPGFAAQVQDPESQRALQAALALAEGR